jgi:hypothetical protein
MVIPGAVAYGVLVSVVVVVSVGVAVLVAFVVALMRLERAQKRIEEDRPPMPVGWPISTADAAPSAPRVVRPGGLRDPEIFVPQAQNEPS